MAVTKSFRQKISETEYGDPIAFGADAINVSTDDGGNAQEKFDDIYTELGREITEAEYNALSDEEKNTGTYYITDMDATEASSSDIIYDNSNSTLTSTNVQAAIDEVDNKIEGLDAADVGAATPEYVDEQIALVTSTGIPKLMVYPLSAIAETEGQTVFTIDLSTFDATTDTVFVQSGRTMLAPEQDFNIVDNTVVLVEGVPAGRTITIYVFKNVPMGEDGSVSGAVIADGTIPASALAEQYLPLTGGTLSGSLKINRNISGAYTELFKNEVAENDYGTYLSDFDKNGNRIGLVIQAKNFVNHDSRYGLVFFDHNNKGYSIFGEHNKPTGTYTGNGSAEQRTINTGGIGRVVAIYSGARMAIATGGGTILADSSGITYINDCTIGSDGNINMASSHSAINQSGQGYYYEVL